MAESSVAFRNQLIDHITDTFRIPSLGGTPAERIDYTLAEAVATSVASHVIATRDEAERQKLVQHSRELTKMGFLVGREARNAEVVGMITPHTVSGFTPYTEADVARAYIKNAVNHIAQRKSITDIESDDVFKTRSGGTITVRELLEKAVKHDITGGGAGRLR